MAMTKQYPSQPQERPSVTVNTDVSNLTGVSSGSTKPILLLGMAHGGKPGEVYAINTYADAKSIFRGGDLLDAIEVALSPNSTTNSGTIYAERVGDATQASFTNKGLSVASKVYSVEANGIQTALVENTLNGTYSFKVNFSKDMYSRSYNNLGNIFGITYTGEQNYASISIEVDEDINNDGKQHTKQATTLVLKVGADQASAQIVKQFPLGDDSTYNTISKLLPDINGIAGFVSQYFPSGNKNIKTKYLDKTTDLAISKDVGRPTYITSLGGDLQNTLGTDNDSVVSVNYNPADGEPDPYELTSLTGGTSSSVAPASWAREIQQFKDTPGYYLVPLTDDVTIQAEALAFCADASSTNPVSLLVGGGINDSMNASTNRAAALRSTEARVGVVANSVWRKMNDGTLKNLPAYITAAMLAGLASGLPVGESVTFKTIDVDTIDQKFTKSELDSLDLEGVISIEYVRNRGGSQEFRVTNDVTTARTISNSVPETELGAGELVDYLAVDLRADLEQFIGLRTSLLTDGDIKAEILRFLMDKQNSGMVLDYESSQIHVVIIGESATVNVPITIVRSLKYITANIGFSDAVLSI